MENDEERGERVGGETSVVRNYMNIRPRRRRGGRHNGALQRPQYGRSVLGATYFPMYAFLNALFMGLLQLEYQNKHVTPLQRHPTSMWIFLITTFTYCLVLTTAKIAAQSQKFRNYSRTLSHACHILAILSTVSLVSILVRNWFSWLMIVTGAIFLVIVAACCFIHEIWHWLYHHWTMVAVHQVLEIFRRFSGGKEMENGDVLV